MCRPMNWVPPRTIATMPTGFEGSFFRGAAAEHEEREMAKRMAEKRRTRGAVAGAGRRPEAGGIALLSHVAIFDSRKCETSFRFHHF